MPRLPAIGSLLLALTVALAHADDHAGHAAGAGHSAVPQPPASEVFDLLVAGNERFAAGAPRHPDQSNDVRHELENGQHPHAVVLSCSDSRVPPELIFDEGLGRLFVIRLAGDVLGSESIASIEYALEHLHVPLVVVLGHEACGAVGAALSTPDGQSAGSPHLDKLLSEIRPHVVAYAGTQTSDKSLVQPVHAHVDAITRELLSQSSIASELVAQGKVKIARGIYRLGSGKVEFWDAPEGGAGAAH